VLGGIEAGGTKFQCVVGTGPGDIRAERRVPTTTPAATLHEVVTFFHAQRRRHGALTAIGHITSTPKPGWAHVDLAGTFRREFGVPVAFDTDVNAAVLGEWRHGAAQGLDTVLYLTVGTGIGGGALVGGRLLHGLVHPEMGHVRLPHDRAADPFPGVCPFHGDCLEGLASGVAMAARWGVSAESLPPDHEAWTLEARYLALALHGFVCTLSPQRIVMGGGVMTPAHLLPRVRQELQALLNGYIRHPAVLHDMERYVVAPALGSRAGAVGALVLAAQAAAAGATA
jgi:fructokinase